MNEETVEVDVRVATVQDAKAILGLCRRVMKESPFVIGQEAEEMSVEQQKSNILNYAQSPNSLLVVAEVDMQLVGMANLTVLPSSKQAHVAEIGVMLIKEYFGYGIATLMMEMLLEFATHTSLKVLTLEVVEQNTKAIRLYERFGFKCVGKLSKRLRYDFKDYDTLIMEKVLE